MEKRFCEHCKSELSEYEMNGNYGWHCPNDCDFEIACKKYEAEFIPDEIPPDDQEISQTTCWYCYKHFFRLEKLQDHPYGHFCPYCHHSLRDNPIYGEGRPRDCALNSQFA
jgi:hypothetical protein